MSRGAWKHQLALIVTSWARESSYTAFAPIAIDDLWGKSAKMLTTRIYDPRWARMDSHNADRKARSFKCEPKGQVPSIKLEAPMRRY
jgi:hypothetical protein